MKVFRGLSQGLRGLIGLFVDDGALALSEIGLLVGIGLLLRLGAVSATVGMAVLVAGTLGVLLANVLGAALKSRR